MRLFFGITAFILLSLGSMPAFAGGDAASAACPQCVVYHHLQTKRPVATSVRLICLPFRQPYAGKVVIFVYNDEGAITYTHAKMAKRFDQYCIGAQRLSDVTVKVVLCNGTATATLKRDLVADVRARGAVPKGHFLCLFGDACARFDHS